MKQTFIHVGNEGRSRGDWFECVDIVEKLNYSRHTKNPSNASSTNSIKYITDKGLILYYSYQTCIGFEWEGKGYKTSRKYSASTSKHQSYIYNLDVIPEEEFRELLHQAVLESKAEEIFKQGIANIAEDI